MIRGTFANIRLRNQIAPGTEGGFTRDFTVDGAPVTTVYDASVNYAAAGIPLVVLAGKEYGSGSSRDWAAKGTALLGVRVVIAESYERIHRSNLIGMGVLPLQFPEGADRRVPRVDGRGDLLRVEGVTALNEGFTPKTMKVTAVRTPTAPWSSSTRSCASTPRGSAATTSTAASCSTCCETSPRAEPDVASTRRPPSGGRLVASPGLVEPLWTSVGAMGLQ